MKKITIDKILISKHIKIFDVLQKLQNISARCLIIIDKDKKLLGTINDGDIRRALIKGVKINNKITNVYFKKPILIKFSMMDFCFWNKSDKFSSPLSNKISIINDFIF